MQEEVAVVSLSSAEVAERGKEGLEGGKPLPAVDDPSPLHVRDRRLFLVGRHGGEEGNLRVGAPV